MWSWVNLEDLISKNICVCACVSSYVLFCKLIELLFIINLVYIIHFIQGMKNVHNILLENVSDGVFPVAQPDIQVEMFNARFARH